MLINISLAPRFKCLYEQEIICFSALSLALCDTRLAYRCTKRTKSDSSEIKVAERSFWNFPWKFHTKHFVEKSNKKDRSPCSQKRSDEPNLSHLCQIESRALCYMLQVIFCVNWKQSFLKKYLKKPNSLWECCTILNHIDSKRSSRCCFKGHFVHSFTHISFLPSNFFNLKTIIFTEKLCNKKWSSLCSLKRKRASFFRFQA